MQTKLTLPISLQLQHCYQLPCIELQTRDSKNSHIVPTENVNLLIKSSLPARTQRFYPADFVKLYLLIKINSLAKKECAINSRFLSQIIAVYNEKKLIQIGVSCTQAEMISQILNKIEDFLYLSRQQLVNISQGNGLLAASSVWLIKNADLFLRKQQFAFCLSFVALGGRQMAFTPIVHQEKYHTGQIYFAKRVSQLFHLKQKSVKEQIKVQDPYSMRCSPQVYGVSYDCLSQLKMKAIYLLNKPHMKNVSIKGITLPNILAESDTYALKMDYLLCSLQQIGSTMFLRTERILNEYLGKNKLKQLSEYVSLLSMLKSAKSYTSKNKILSQMTNHDTINIDSYNQDIFYNSASYFNKITEIFNNLYYLLTLELLSSIEALKLAYKGEQKTCIQFINVAMQDNYNLLNENMSVWKKSESLSFVEKSWLK